MSPLPADSFFRLSKPSHSLQEQEAFHLVITGILLLGLCTNIRPWPPGPKERTASHPLPASCHGGSWEHHSRWQEPEGHPGPRPLPTAHLPLPDIGLYSVPFMRDGQAFSGQERGFFPQPCTWAPMEPSVACEQESICVDIARSQYRGTRIFFHLSGFLVHMSQTLKQP